MASDLSFVVEQLSFHSTKDFESATLRPPESTDPSLHNDSTPAKLGLGHPQYYGLLYKIVGCSFVSAIFSVGFLGNLMVVYVVWRSRSMRTTTNCYLVSLAVADVLLLVSAPLPTIVEYFLIVDESLFGAGGCSVMVFCQFLGVNLSSLSITAFTVERYIAICHPIRAQTLCTITRAMRIIAALWLFGVVYCAPWLGLTTVKVKVFADGTQIQHCDFKLERNYYLTYFMADLIIFYVAPLLLTCVLYGLIARILYRSSLLGTPGAVATHADVRLHGDAAVVKGNGGRAAVVVRSHRAATQVSSRIQVTKMLAVVVCVFAVLWLPYRAYVVYNSFARRRYEDHWFMLFCRLMVYINSAVNPILYNAMSVKFRRAFRRLLCCCGGDGGGGGAGGGGGGGEKGTTQNSSHVTGHEVVLVELK